MNSQKVELDLNLVQAVINYLGSRPFVEVADLIMAVREQVTPQVQAPVHKEQDSVTQ